MLLATVLGLDAKTWEAEDIPMVHLTDARRYVCDPDEILSQTERDSIDSYLLRLDKQCGVESVFVIVKRVSNGDTFRFAQDLGNRQGVVMKSYPSLNHLFMSGEGASMPEEYQTPGHVAEEVMDDIANFILSGK